MKTQLFSFVLALLLTGSGALKAQDRQDEYIGLPGDNLNLYAVMHLFQNSETLEGFERSLNDPETIINNLDLNGDNSVDYIMVYNYADGNIHTIVLRVAINENEQQDVAVFTVEKLRDGAVQIQLIGDQALYGANYIIEPVYSETPNPGYASTVTKQKVQTRRNVTVVRTTYYEVASWPVIVYIYQPTYSLWRSSYRWGYYPIYWHPRAPHYYHYYYGYHYNWYDHYYTYYRPWKQPRCVHYRTVYYTTIRNYSPTVVVNINKGTYKNTYSRPEKKSDGERVYAQRQSTGSNIPPGKSSVGAAEGIQGSRPGQEVNERGTRPVNEGRTTEVRDLRTGNATRTNTETSSSRNETASPGRSSRSEDAQKTTAPRREDATSKERQENRASREQVAHPRSEESSRTSRPASPATKKESTTNSSKEKSSSSGRVERPSSEPGKSVTRTAPASSKKESRPAVESSKPAKTESRTESRVKTPDRSSSKSAGKAESKSSGSHQSSSETKSNSPGRR